MERQIVEKKCDHCESKEQFVQGQPLPASFFNWINVVTLKPAPGSAQQQIQNIIKQACSTSCAINILKTQLEEKMGSSKDLKLTDQAEAVLKNLPRAN
jgi:hypothetical protein